MNVVALICARGGSKGIPGKNIRLLAGRPLLEWAVVQARSVPRVRRVVVSTDSREIAEMAVSFGADVPFLRPAELAEDNSPEWAVWQHALRALRDEEGAFPDALLVVPTTAPLRAVSDLERCLDEFGRGDADVVLTITHAHSNPYFNMVKVDEDGLLGRIFPLSEPVARRQDAPAVFDVTPVGYVARPEYVMSSSGIFEGRVRGVQVSAERALDIDTTLDLRVAELLMSHES
ncbi:MAG: acylneuraminate cytidylyltransferase family protein [Bacillota bacterium]|nr:acylneuraminate cytidylyltransferase family protein [Bacillota bacterium]